MQKIHYIGHSESEIKKELEKSTQFKKFELGKDADTIFIDFQDKACSLNADIVNYAKKNCLTLVMINAAGKSKISELFKTVISGNIMVVFCREKYNVINVLDTENIKVESENYIVEVKGKDNGEAFASAPIKIGATDNSKDEVNPAEYAKRILGILSYEYKSKYINLINEYRDNDDFPVDLPPEQYNFNYFALNAVYDFGGQTVENYVLMEALLVASYNPKCKYLRIRSLGTGFNPASNGGSLKWDDTYERGYFQGRIDIHMEPLNNKLQPYATSPLNTNGTTTYTSGTSFTVGVDVSENPSCQASYTIENSKTYEISDFNIINASAGLDARWGFQLGLIQNSIWDIFNEPFMRKAQVKELPILAKKNLQVLCQGIWRVDDNPLFKEIVNLELHWHGDYYHCWVEGDWTAYTENYYRIGLFQYPTFFVNFSSVKSQKEDE